MIAYKMHRPACREKSIRHAVFCPLLLFLGLLLGSVVSPPSANAQVVENIAEEFAESVTDDPVAQEEIGELVEFLADTLPDGRRAIEEASGRRGVGRPSRGLSDPFADILMNFDKLTCAAWIISYRDWYLGLIIADDPPTSPQTLQAAHSLYNKVIAGCREVLDEETYEVLGEAPAPVSQPDSEDEGDTSPLETDLIDGVLMTGVTDNICWNRCRDEHAAWKSAEAERVRAERTMKRARRRADVIESDTIPWLERRLGSAEAELERLEAQRPPYPRQNPPLNVEIARKAADISNLQTEIRQKTQEVTSLRQQAERLERSLPNLVQREQAALQAYLECLKKCLAEAQAAGETSSFAEETIRNLEVRSNILDDISSRLAPRDSGRGGRSEIRRASGGTWESQSVRTARLDAIGTLRTGAASDSGTNVAPAFAIRSIDETGRVIRDVEERVFDVRHAHDDMGAAGRDYGETTQSGTDEVGHLQQPRSFTPIETGNSISRMADPQNSPTGQQTTVPAQAGRPNLSGRWVFVDGGSGVSQVSIRDEGNVLIVSGMGPTIQLERDGNRYFGAGAVLFGQGNHNIVLTRDGSRLRLQAQHPAGGSFATQLMRAS